MIYQIMGGQTRVLCVVQMQKFCVSKLPQKLFWDIGATSCFLTTARSKASILEIEKQRKHKWKISGLLLCIILVMHKV